jgi:hypothetical protein
MRPRAYRIYGRFGLGQQVRGYWNRPAVSAVIPNPLEGSAVRSPRPMPRIVDALTFHDPTV